MLQPDPMPSDVSECFEFYGLSIVVSSAETGLVEEVRRDFAYFRSASPIGSAAERVVVYHSPPPWDELPDLPALVITPRNVSFEDHGTSYIDYFGRGLAIYDRPAHTCTVYATDQDLLHEIVYLFVLSTVGRHLDARRLHRVHALGVSYEGRGILLLLPSGGGKSTMALALLRRPGFQLLGEDTPLVDRHGHILPFPLRLGVRPEQEVDIPAAHLRTVRRMEFDPKTLIDIEYFQDRIGTTVAPGFILVGERNLSERSEIVPLARHRAFKALAKYMIVGLGIYQGMEFLLERSAWEIVGRGGVAFSRLYNGMQLLRSAPTYRFVLGRSPERNCETLLAFLARSGRGALDESSDGGHGQAS